MFRIDSDAYWRPAMNTKRPQNISLPTKAELAEMEKIHLEIMTEKQNEDRLEALREMHYHEDEIDD